MSSVHVIRLRGPWRYAIAAAAGQAVLPTCRVAALGTELSGRIEFHRAFNRPTNLDDERVLLAIEPAAPLVAVWLNGAPLTLRQLQADSPTLRYDLTDHLAAGNELRLKQELAPQPADDEPLVGEVWLEIQES